MKKEILALTASILVIVLVLGAVTELVSPKRHNYGSDWGEFLQEEEEGRNAFPHRKKRFLWARYLRKNFCRRFLRR